MLKYALRLSHRRDGLVIARFPDVPRAVAYGCDDGEAYQEATKSLQAALLHRMKAGLGFPKARARGRRKVTVNPASLTVFA